MSAPQKILDLIELFERNAADYRSAEFKEAEVRQQFINPFFKCLGWDMENERGDAEAYKDVVHEAALKIGGATKAPDYSMRIGGTRKFFLEAKKPAVNIEDDPQPAYQLRRYGWSAKLPLSILTNFEEFAVYDCRIQPHKTDKASIARTFFFTYKDYPQRWDEIAAIFSPEAIRKGSFDKYAETAKLKKGTATVDEAFLEEIEGWRDLLARNLAMRNPALVQRDLNYAVQVTIDRIIFLRMCEDRSIEQYGQLMALQNGTPSPLPLSPERRGDSIVPLSPAAGERGRGEGAVYGRLMQLFRNAGDRYNSGLFSFNRDPKGSVRATALLFGSRLNDKDRPEPPDELTPELTIDDKVLKDIIKGLYYPDSSYEFSVLPAEILGQVYEQFLGKVIRLTAGHQAKVEDKPEVKKAGGVYYTPAHIVDYIVKHTVGKLLGSPSGEPPGLPRRESAAATTPAARESEPQTCLTPRQAAKLRILDPACGSGSFLIGAYQYLLDWHRDRYVESLRVKPGGTPEDTKELYQSPGGWRLTTAERKRILLNNIYGVDIDPRAVEVTKLSLLLKVLEGESQETLERQRRMFHERALPDLASNIKCGNSLIGPDFYEGQQLTMFDEEERQRINVFDWKDEFAEIMKAGGFDAVIGNPPWGQKAIAEGEAVKQYAWKQYPSSRGIFDLFRPFVERGIRLVAADGMFGMVLPDIVLLKDYPDTRCYLLDQLSLSRIDWWGMAFPAAVIDAATIIGNKGPAFPDHSTCAAIHDGEASFSHLIPQRDFGANPRFVFNLHLTPEKRKILCSFRRDHLWATTLKSMKVSTAGTSARSYSFLPGSIRPVENCISVVAR